VDLLEQFRWANFFGLHRGAVQGVGKVVK